MINKKRVLQALVFGSLVVAGMCFVYRRDILIKYHLNRRAEIERSFYRHPGQPKQGGFDVEEAEIQHHLEALIEMGYLQKVVMGCPERLVEGGTNETVFYKRVTNSFGASVMDNFWSYTRETNTITVLARGADIPRWRRLIADFDSE